MATAARSSGPKTRETRPVATGRASRVQFNSSTTEDNTTLLRLQSLRAHSVFSVSLANTVATLAWGVSHG